MDRRGEGFLQEVGRTEFDSTSVIKLNAIVQEMILNVNHVNVFGSRVVRVVVGTCWRSPPGSC